MTAVSVYDFGAAGNGIADDTAAVQAAIDQAARQGQAVYFEPGRYSVGELFLHEGSVLTAEPNWGYGSRLCGSTVLEQRFEDQRSLLNISEAFQCTVSGLSLYGGKPGGCTGILSRKNRQGPKEDTFRIERTKVSSFGGDGLRLEHGWCFTLRQSMFSHNKGDGIHLSDSFDGFISDTWLSGNAGCGYGTSGENNAVTMSGCRIEWNQTGGIVIRGGSHYQLTGNYIDRSGRQGIYITTGRAAGKQTFSNTIAVTGNIIYRSGKLAEDPAESCHLALERALGVTVTGNTCCVGRDDMGKGRPSPVFGIRISDCRESVIAGNTLFCGAEKTLLFGEGNEDVVIRDNPGSLFTLTAEQTGQDLPPMAAARIRMEQEGTI